MKRKPKIMPKIILKQQPYTMWQVPIKRIWKKKTEFNNAIKHNRKDLKKLKLYDYKKLIGYY